MDNKHKHLDYIQELIKRMSTNSFFVKGWAITISTTLLAITSKSNKDSSWILSLLPILTFWGIDSYYLYKERLYRTLYEKVRKQLESEIDYNMNTDEFVGGKRTWLSSMFSKATGVFYVSLITLTILVIFYLR